MQRVMITLIFLLNSQLFIISSDVWANANANVGYQYAAMNFRGTQDLAQHKEFAQYLATNIDKTIHTELIVPSAIVTRATIADMMLVNPVTAIKIMQQGDFEIIATLKHREVGGKLAGLIVVHRDSPIKTLSDLANKVVAIIDKKNAAGGFLFQAQAMLNAGLNPVKDFSNFIVIPNQNAIVKHVIAKNVDAGCIRSGQLENYVKTGGDISQLRVLNNLAKPGETARSTAFYPHWAFLVRKSLPTSVKENLKQALFAITAERPWRNKNYIGGFVQVDQQGYDRLRKTMERLARYY